MPGWDQSRRLLETTSPPRAPQAPGAGFEALEPRLLLSASVPDQATFASASGQAVVAAAISNDVVYQEQTQLDNFYKPNTIAFDFPIHQAAVNGVIDITALSDLDSESETVAYDIEGIVTGTLFTGTDPGTRPFTAQINLSDPDLAAIADDGNLHIEFTPNSNVDDFQNVNEYVTVALTYTPPPFTVDTPYLKENRWLTNFSDQVQFRFSGSVLPGSLEPADLTLNGTPAIDITPHATIPNQFIFTFPEDAWNEGPNSLVLPAGSVQSQSGTPLEAFTRNFRIDSIPPTIIESSILQEQTVPAGDLTLTLKFSEPVNSPLLLDGGHFRLLWHTGTPEVVYDPATDELHVTYTDVAEGRHVFIISTTVGLSKLADEAGNTLDGESNPLTTVPTGNGYSGGTFSLYFNVEDGVSSPLELASDFGLAPSGIVYRATFSDTPDFTGDEQRYTFDLESDQLVTISIDKSLAGPEVALELLDPSGSLVATSPDGLPVLTYRTTAGGAGTYTLVTRTLTYSAEPFSGQAVAHAVVEAERSGGPANDDYINAQSLDAAWVSLGEGVQQAVVLGDMNALAGPLTIAESFPSTTLGPAWETYSSYQSVLEVTSQYGAADGAYALSMDGNFNNGINEAIWTVNLSGFEDAQLRFAHSNRGDDYDPLPDDFTGSHFGDGVSISGDGVHWHTVYNLPASSHSGWQYAGADLRFEAFLAGIPLGENFKIKFQQSDTVIRAGFGRSYDAITITGTAVQPPAPDVYSVTLAPGEELSAVLGLVGGNTRLKLLDPTGEVITVGVTGWEDASQAIQRFTSETGGVYYLSVEGAAGSYALTVTKGASQAPDPVADIALPLGPSGKVVSIFEDSPGNTPDRYSFFANSGDSLTAWTTLPEVMPRPDSGWWLDSYLELYDPDGLLVAQADGGGDGLNALINFTTQQTGQYTVKLRHADAPPGGTYTQGPYLLHVTGNTGGAPALQVLSTSLDGDGYINVETHDVTVNFSGPLDLNTVIASGFTSNGIPADDFTVVDSDSITFSFSAGFSQGINTVMLAEGSVLGLDGSPVAAFTQEVTYDTIAPRIISSTISQGDVLETGHIQLVIVFDEALDTTDLDRSDIYFYTSSAKSLNRPYIDQFDYDQATSTLTLGIQATAEGDYTVRLLDSRFYDLAGNRLDGENPGTPMPPAVSGNGVPGGYFTLDFSVDRTQPDEITTAVRQNLQGSLASLSRNSGFLNHAGDVDTFRFFAQTGQIITAVLDPITTLSAPITLTGPGGAISDGTVSAPTLLTYTHTGPDGMVEWSVQGEPDSATYDLNIYINATVEAALPVGPTPDDNAYDLTNAWLNLPGSVRTATVFGTSQPARVSITNDISSQSSFQVNFYSLTTPTGDGTLTITAMADLDAEDEYLTINGENTYVSSAFTTDGSDTGIVTTTLTIPRAQLASMASNTSIIFTITPSGAVDSLSGSFVKVELDYPGLVEPQIDTYALELQAGESLTATLDRWQTTGATLDLINHATGQAVAIGEPAPGYTHTLQSFVAPTTGRYDLRVHTLRSDDYVLTLLQHAVFDLKQDADNTTALPDGNSTALGLLQSPDGDRLFAVTNSNPQSGTPGIFELNPDTLEPIGFTPFREGLTGNVNTGFSLAFDGVNLFTISGHTPNVQVLDPDLGVVIDTLDLENLINPYRIGYYGGYLIGFTEPKGNGQLRFIDPDSGRTDHDLPLQPAPDHVVYIAPAGAEARGSIFIAVRRTSGYFISEIDAQTGDPLNTFMVETDSILDLAYVDGKIILTQGNVPGQVGNLNYISAYDPDTGELLNSIPVQVSLPASPATTNGYTAIAGDGRIPRVPTDRYSLALNAGQTVTFSTETPFDHPGGAPLNNLDPAIRLLDPNGVEVAFDQNSADDGRNARLTFTATLTGTYTIEVLAESGSGEYLLHADKTPALAGDLDGDGFVGIADLNIVLGHWNQTVAVGNLAHGDPSGDGFVGIQDLNAVLGNWNATLLPPAIQGDLDNDGFVGISDMNIVLGGWNQNVAPGDLTAGDPSGDGFVSLEDLNLVLGNWNTGTPPASASVSQYNPAEASARQPETTASTSRQTQAGRREIPRSYGLRQVQTQQKQTPQSQTFQWMLPGMPSANPHEPTRSAFRNEAYIPAIGLWEQDDLTSPAVLSLP